MDKPQRTATQKSKPEPASEESLKKSIIELYLQVKIRSTEEIENMDDDLLLQEREQLLNQTPFQILKYIRMQVELIMNLKLDDLKKEENDSEESVDETPASSTKRNKKKNASLIVQSMKDAIKAMDQSRRHALKKSKNEIQAEIPIYENII